MTDNSCMRMLVIFDIDGVIRDVSNSYRKALADTVEHFTSGAYRPTSTDIDELKAEGMWNNDWEASQELVYRHFAAQGKPCKTVKINYKTIIEFFQGRYFGTDPNKWNGYICNERILLGLPYLEQLSLANIAWGFFSGATRASANYILQDRLGLRSPSLIAMEDSPGKPDPTGLFATVRLLQSRADHTSMVIYAGDTVADMNTVENAREIETSINWLGVGVLPPHVQETPSEKNAYAERLQEAGAAIVIENIQELTPSRVKQLLKDKSANPNTN